MKIAVIADIHAHSWADFVTYENGISSRVQATCDALAWAFMRANDLECDAMIIAGDLFQSRGKLAPSVLNAVADTINQHCLGLLTIIVPGNHDLEGYRVENACGIAPGVFKYIDGVVVCDSPQTYEVCGLGVGCIPYIKNEQDFKAAFMKLAADTQPDVFIIHQGIDNFKTDPNMPKTGITAKWLKDNSGDNWVLAGHYHQHQQNGKIISIGPLMHQSFADAGSIDGMVILDLDKNKIEHFPGPAPKFMALKSARALNKKVTGHYVSLKLTKPGEAQKYRDKAKKLGVAGLKITIEKQYTARHTHAIKISKPENMLKAYLEANPNYKDIKEELLTLYHKILET